VTVPRPVSLAAALLIGLWSLSVSPLVVGEPAQAPTATTPVEQCVAVQQRLDTQHQTLTRELRTIKRELALVNQNLERPGLRDIMAGIGYILGLFGIAGFMASRRSCQRRTE
jgi:hypothetical protein